MRTRALPRTDEWQPVCQVSELEVERGATALVHGQAIALFHVVRPDASEGENDLVFALGNHDPYAKASVLAKGIVGWRGDIPIVGSPSHRHAFDLRTGQCLEDPHVQVPAYAVKVEDGMVFVGLRLH